MREIATTQASQAANRIERKERLEKKRRQLVIPDVSTANFERQLKKLATRGVVSLFNAVAKTKRDLEEAGELSSSGTSSKAKGKSKSDAAADRELGALRLAGGPGGIDKTTLSQEVRKLSKENFLGLLSKSEKQSSMAVGIGNNSNSNSNNNSTSNSLSNSNSSGAGSKWAALQDDYLTKGGLTLKVISRTISCQLFTNCGVCRIGIRTRSPPAMKTRSLRLAPNPRYIAINNYFIF